MYLYTFLATLILLLAASSVIIIRSIVLRRRHQRMVEEAIRNGTWLPPSPGGFGSFGHGVNRRRVDLSKKPKLWEAYVGQKDKEPKHSGKVDTITELQWDTIRPFSATYVLPPTARNPASAASSMRRTYPTFAGRLRGLFGRPQHAPAPPSTPDEFPVTTMTTTTAIIATPLLDVASSDSGPTEAQAPTPAQAQASRKVRVAVLIAMPHAPESKSRPVTPPHVASTSTAVLPPRVDPTSDEEPELPHLEVGVAELDLSSTPLPHRKGKEERVSGASGSSIV
ncbi:hypothetical protein C0991_008195 [Blastosporella zonata]|nr:hypothetical protein C0991_008195 [Blastosporella zonata]